ncbi:MAG: type II CRISPR RNA-guided endonuclease Cas9 [Thermogutta sp.]
MEPKNAAKDYVLGIDLGVVSLGWAAIETNDDNPLSLLDAGVRCWELTNATPEDVEKGKEEPPGKARREARLIRRQLFRRAQRLRRTYRVLQSIGLFAAGPRSSNGRKTYLKQIDEQAISWLKQQLPQPVDDDVLPHTFIYHLRKAALYHPLPPELLGRVFYHLAQRRGFLSNRRAAKKDEELGKVKTAISELKQAMHSAGARTLGEYLASLDPREQRIRGRYTARQMYRDEFDQIWAAQRAYYPQILTDQNNAQLYKAIFFQRPLKSQKGLVGRCPLEGWITKHANGQTKIVGPRRAPMACLEAQRIRYMQRINDLEIIDPKGNKRPLTEAERETLYDLAEQKEKLTFTAIKKALKIPNGDGDDGWKFNLEEGGENKLPGNQTAARIRRVLGKKWDELDEAQKKLLVDTIIAYLSPEALAGRLQAVWQFTPDEAENLAHVELENKYHSFSRRAIRKLLPLLRQGKHLNAAIKEVYGDRTYTVQTNELLPPVREVLPTVRNPILVRALTELRKVVNALIRKYGKPKLIRVELARELKRSRSERAKFSERMRKQQKEREEAAKHILQEFKREATPRDIEKYLLAKECNWQCPYTGKKITMESLFGDFPQFDVEHIWPFSRSLDDSFANKTLCFHEENRTVKSNRTPFEAYAANPEKWEEILVRVKQFQGQSKKEKLKRFQAETIPPDFAQRHLNDTRWISREAADYLGYLYGGRVDATRTQRVFTVTGGLTALFRHAWNLNAILGGGPDKERHDHRHHAIDAIVIALTDASMVQRFANQAARLLRANRPTAVPLDPPWETFFTEVKQHVDKIIVSFRPNRRVSGPLHEQTNYAPPAEEKTKVRKRLSALSINEIDDIVDPKVRELVNEKLTQLGEKDPKRAFATDANLPVLRGKNNTCIPIKSVRIWVSGKVIDVGKDHRVRHVKLGFNHHIEIYAILDENGNEVKWDGEIVSLYEAYQRKKRGEPVVCRDHGPNTRFKFSLAKSDYIEWTTEDGKQQLLRVVAISDNNLEFRLPYDARPSTLIRREKERIFATFARLFARRARKVWVTPLGEVFPAND